MKSIDAQNQLKKHKKGIFVLIIVLILITFFFWPKRHSAEKMNMNDQHAGHSGHNMASMNGNEGHDMAAMEGPREIRLTESAKVLAQIETTAVKRAYPEKEIRLVGKIDYDETRVKTITSWFSGRIDKLYIDFTGTQVAKGEVLADVYSPDLITAQSELLTALKFNDYYQGVRIAKEKLKLLGLEPEQIDLIERLDSPESHIKITTPMAGTVTEKYVNEGEYIKTGSKLYKIADLSYLWVLCDAYESDLPWIQLGQSVNIEVEAYPGETFEGVIAFIDPYLNKNTRTINVRIELPNNQGLLKPEMFVNATVRVKLGERAKNGPPLIVPASAVLQTGKRALVYVEVDNATEPTYEGREVVLGSRAGEYYIIKEGLKEGESVVTKGNFKIDSALQINAKKSMMNPEGGAPAMGHAGHKM